MMRFPSVDKCRLLTLRRMLSRSGFLTEGGTAIVMSQERTDTLVVIAATGPDELLVDAVAALGGDALRIQIPFFAGFADLRMCTV